jgi:hypothetical protein
VPLPAVNEVKPPSAAALVDAVSSSCHFSSFARLPLVVALSRTLNFSWSATIEA